ncbi:MAG: hypothetical protein QM733_20075 [Ilumatobacteraceae bacterium]
MDAGFWETQLAEWIGGRRIILTAQVAAACTPTVERLRRLGAGDAFVLDTHGSGTGAVPDCAGLSLALDASGLSLDESIHQGQRALGDLPPDAVAALDAFDPDRTALVIGDFLTESPTLAGRPFLAHRRPEWLALDDKTAIDAFWDRAGIARAPSAVVQATPDAVAAVWAHVDRGDGVVLAVDATHGWTGGAEGTRPVRDRSRLSEAFDGWEGRTMRVTPFLEGVPCSIHGIVFADHVAVFRPVELVVLRRGDEFFAGAEPQGEATNRHGSVFRLAKPDETSIVRHAGGLLGSFFYAGCSSIWDPPPAAREQMRATARRAGEQLRAEVGYRGAFTVDGVLTADGFRPTELNPRNGAGLGTMSRELDFPLQLLLDALVGGVELDWRAPELESGLLQHFDEHRAGGTWRMIPTAAVEPRQLVHGDDHGLVGPAVSGCFVRMPMQRPAGTFLGPHAADFWQWADAELGLGIGSLAPAAQRWI